MTFHICDYDNDTSVKIVITSVVGCLIFMFFVVPIMFNTFATPEIKIADEFSTYLKQQVDECKSKNQSHIEAWKKAGESNAAFFMELQCNVAAINKFISEHSRVAEPKK